MFLSTKLIDDFIQMRTTSDLVRVVAQPLITVMRAGEQRVIAVEFSVTPGYYIMADRGSDKHLLYSTVRATSDVGIALEEARFPNPIKEIIPGLPGLTEIFRDVIKVHIPVHVDIDAKKGIHHIYGSMRYQPCDARQCFFPKELNFHVKLRIV